MKLGRFTREGTTRLGKVMDDEIVDLTAAGLGTSMRSLITNFPDLRPQAEGADGPRFALSDVILEAPIDDPQKFLALGMNYKAHADKAAAAGITVPKTQLWFNKQVSCINGPYASIDMPKVSEELDYEVELAVIIGTSCRHVTVEQARSVIFGYAVADDVSVRDWQFSSPTFTLGKSFDTHGPFGPWITTGDAVADPQNLRITAWVNGEVRQDSNTSDMIYPIAEQIAHISKVMTLYPGDVLLTGTPEGTGIESQTFLKVGDKVRMEIEGLGAIENTVAPEAA